MLPEEEVGAEGGEEDDQDGRLPEHVEVEAEDEVGAETEQDCEQHELRQEEHLHCSPTETLHPQTGNLTFKACSRGGGGVSKWGRDRATAYRYTFIEGGHLQLQMYTLI